MSGGQMVDPFDAALHWSRVVAILRGSTAAHIPAAATVLIELGIDVLEMPLTTPGALEAIAEVRSAHPDAFVGAGTVLSAIDAESAIDAGAQFLVAPAACPGMVSVAAARGLPSLPGFLTPSEALASVAGGATHVKLFPASATTPDLLRQMLVPLPHLKVVPTGGVDLEAAHRWISSGAVAVGVGSPLLGDALETGDLVGLATRAAQWRAELG